MKVSAYNIGIALFAAIGTFLFVSAIITTAHESQLILR